MFIMGPHKNTFRGLQIFLMGVDHVILVNCCWPELNVDSVQIRLTDILGYEPALFQLLQRVWTTSEDVSKYAYFNTNNLWVHLGKLKELFDKSGGALPLPATWYEGVIVGGKRLLKLLKACWCFHVSVSDRVV